MARLTAPVRLTLVALGALGACGGGPARERAHDAAGPSAGDAAVDAAGDGAAEPMAAPEPSPDVAPAPPDAALDEPRGADGSASADSADSADSVYRRAAPADAARPEVGAGPYHALAIATGRNHTCARLDDGNVKCWGLNTAGQLGYGDTYRRGSDPTDMGDNLPLVDLGAGRFATAIAAGGDTTCAILENGALKCWGGGNSAGQPGGGNLGDQPAEMGDALPEVNLGDHAVTMVGMGATVACALLDDGSARCWGLDAQSLTPVPVSLGSAKPVTALSGGESGMLALFSDGTATRLLSKITFPLLGPGVRATQVGGGIVGDCALVGGVVTCAPEASPTITMPDDAFFHYGVAGSDDGLDGTFVGPTPLPRLLGFGRTLWGGTCAMYDGGRVGCQRSVSWWPCTPDWCAFATASGDGTELMNLGQPAVALTSGGDEHICGLLANGEVRCWGGNEHPAIPNDALGSSFDMEQVNGQWVYGRFHSIDLGTHR
jgi:hypothetical protein